jgi:hypothetical protein
MLCRQQESLSFSTVYGHGPEAAKLWACSLRHLFPFDRIAVRRPDGMGICAAAAGARSKQRDRDAEPVARMPESKAGKSKAEGKRSARPDARSPIPMLASWQLDEAVNRRRELHPE